jgi:hypothetical protein
MAAHPQKAFQRSQIRFDSTNVIVFTTYTVIYPCSKIIKKEQIYKKKSNKENRGEYTLSPVLRMDTEKSECPIITRC